MSHGTAGIKHALGARIAEDARNSRRRAYVTDFSLACD